MPDATVRIAAGVLCLTFAWAALAKIVNARAWAEALRAYGLYPAVRRTAALLTPAAELAACVLLLTGRTRAGGALIIAMLAVFSFALVRARALQLAQTGRGDRLPCGCFGKVATRDYRLLLARNALLALPAAAVLIGGRDVHVFEELRAPEAGDLLPLALVVAGVALGAWLAWELAASLRRGQRS